MSKQLSLLAVPHEDAACRVGKATFASIIAARQAEPGFKLDEPTLIAHLRAPLAKEMPKAARIGTRNVLFDALAVGCGLKEPFTTSARGQIAKALKEIREVEPSVGADDLTAAAAWICRKYEKCGPMGVAAHWHEASKHRSERTRTAKMDIYQEPPDGWREAAKKRYPDALDWGNPHDFSTIAWLDVSTAIRPDILKAIT